MPQIDVELALHALDGNLELLKDLASMFVEDVPILLDQLKTAVSDDHPLQARSAMHSLKGLVATFYAKTSVEIAQRLENSAANGSLDLFMSGELEKLEECIRLVIADFEARGWLNRV